MTFGKDLVAHPRRVTDERILRVFGAPPPPATVTVCPKLVLPPEERYIPSPPLNFCVELALTGPVSKRELFDVFTQEWFRSADMPHLCGREIDRGEVFFVGTPASEKFLASRGVEKNPSYDRVYFAISVLDEDEPIASDRFETLLADVRRVASRWAPRPLVQPREAAAAAVALAEVCARCRDEVAFDVLGPPEGFSGRSIWNVLHTIGLVWGDMDLFNWTTDSEWNDPVLFWVATNTEPYYFVPEEIVAEKRYADLRFAMAVGAKPDPTAIARAMLAFGAEASSRLGGTLDVDPETFVADVRAVQSELEARGFPPGAPATVELV